MQHSSISYTDKMAWLTPQMQKLFMAAVNAPNQQSKLFYYGVIAELRAAK